MISAVGLMISDVGLMRSAVGLMVCTGGISKFWGGICVSLLATAPLMRTAYDCHPRVQSHATS